MELTWFFVLYVAQKLLHLDFGGTEVVGGGKERGSEGSSQFDFAGDVIDALL